MEDGALRRSERGTPLGGVISPLLSNLYLHHVLDLWFERDVKLRLHGRAFAVRFADDAVLAFEREEDAFQTRTHAISVLHRLGNLARSARFTAGSDRTSASARFAHRSRNRTLGLHPVPGPVSDTRAFGAHTVWDISHIRHAWGGSDPTPISADSHTGDGRLPLAAISGMVEPCRQWIVDRGPRGPMPRG